MKVIGVLALQGDFAEHMTALRELGAQAKEVRLPADLKDCDGLIIPGGESTTMSLLLDIFELREPLKQFKGPVWGTCAGAILLGRGEDPKVKNLELMDIEVERNAYGRQTESFEADLNIKESGAVRGVFIRAPRIKKTGGKVSVLSEFKGDAVLVRQGRYLAGTFHPELTGSAALHKYFLSLVKKAGIIAACLTGVLGASWAMELPPPVTEITTPSVFKLQKFMEGVGKKSGLVYGERASLLVDFNTNNIPSMLNPAAGVKTHTQIKLEIYPKVWVKGWSKKDPKESARIIFRCAVMEIFQESEAAKALIILTPEYSALKKNNSLHWKLGRMDALAFSLSRNLAQTIRGNSHWAWSKALQSTVEKVFTIALQRKIIK